MSGTEARAAIETEIRRELFGPSESDQPRGKPLDCPNAAVTFDSKEDSWGAFHCAATGQEILTESSPLKRYGVGILYSGGSLSGSITGDADIDPDVETPDVPGLPQNAEDPSGAPVEVKIAANTRASDDDDFDLTDANRRQQSAMGISFQARVPQGGSAAITVTGAYYERLKVHVPGVEKHRDWWRRVPFALAGEIHGDALRDDPGRLTIVPTDPIGNAPSIKPTVKFLSRAVVGADAANSRLITVVLVNQTSGSGPSAALFQTEFQVQAQGGLEFEPYPEVRLPERDEEERSLELLYRRKRTFAIGHGCAAEWQQFPGTETSWLKAIALPSYEVESLTPDIFLTDDTGAFLLDHDGDRQPVSVSMDALARDTPEGREQVGHLLDLYGSWITHRRVEIPRLPERLREPAEAHMARAEDALSRMKQGWNMVLNDELASQAFRWANAAMLEQQFRSNIKVREVQRGKDDRVRVTSPHPKFAPTEGLGNWRPFQIAFLLASLPELVDRAAPKRSLVDLIFFPTGGGKTEAYLGAAAISLLARRLRNPQDVGTDTLMRYTLRLLTAQQFLRAASLICVLEKIRSENEAALGEGRFGIGVWLGRDSTPNTWNDATSLLKKLGRDAREQNRFLLLRCPWCGTQMGTMPKSRGGQYVIGYEHRRIGNKVIFKCIDPECYYARGAGLPVHVVDEDIYDVRPSIVIGTVDKFAMMAWRPRARRLFGLGDDFSREVSPPGLIVQDEVHLISGPLGSMMGLYEPIIDELCTDRRGATAIEPKIIASTATVRRYESQIAGLFGRTSVALFPPHGLEEGHSFFAEPARQPDGTREPGRRYLGVMSPSLGSIQTVQVRVAAATLQGATKIPEEYRDGYWTNLNFLNSLRELGNTVSLLQSDVPDYLTGLRRRDGITPRWPRSDRIMELTSRRQSDEIPRAIEQLQVSYVPTDEGSQRAVDICLASNIIEVGIDIERLALMTIVGQPKTTAQYIQVSGRVGRKPSVSPGLVVTIYGALKPRDRSHYERFMTYHQQLYAQVEPTSVTPFATPVLRRALHAAAVAYIRQTSTAVGPSPFPEQDYERAIALLRERAMIADPEEVPALDKVAKVR
ncbi:MAG: helicase, partial [Actinobacteria bacterium HGW-Actinobacteria-8]